MSQVTLSVIPVEQVVDSSSEDVGFNNSNYTFFNEASFDKVGQSDRSFKAQCEKRDSWH